MTLVIQALVSMSIVTVPVLAPSAAGDVGVGADYVGLYIGIVYLASMLSTIASGQFVRRLGSIRISQLCLLVSALGLALLSVSSLPAVVASALLVGFAQGPVTPASSHLLVRLTQAKDLALALSIKQTGVPLGGALAGAVVPLLVLINGWSFAALVVSAACALLAFMIQPIRAAYDGDRQSGRAMSARGAVRPLVISISMARVRRLAACAFAFSALQLSLVTYLVTYLNTRLGYSLVQAGMMLALLQGTSIVARIFWGAVADRVSRPSGLLAILALGMATCAVLIGLSTASWSVAAIATLCVATGATALGWNGVVLGEVAREAPAGQTVEATSGVVFFTYFGVLVGPPAFALTLQEAGSYLLGFVLLAIPPLLCCFWLLFAAAREKRLATLPSA